MTRHDVKLVGVGTVDPAVLDYLSLVLSSSFAAECEILNVRIDPHDAFISKRRQYDSNQILSQLLQLDVGCDSKILGVTDVDLCVPIFTFVFGLAQVDGRAALISLCRLRQQFYGLRGDEKLFLLRCEKEAFHELGHAHGLVHCSSYDCVMHFSNSIEQVDVKSAQFCALCAQSLQSLSLKACRRDTVSTTTR